MAEVWVRLVAVTHAVPELLCSLSTGSSLSSESSPVSSPATNHSSPASTPKRVPMGPIIVPPGGHSVPSTPPVVTIAPTKTVNGVWRSESRQVSGAAQRWGRSGSDGDRACPCVEFSVHGSGMGASLASHPGPQSLLQGALDTPPRLEDARITAILTSGF